MRFFGLTFYTAKRSMRRIVSVFGLLAAAAVFSTSTCWAVQGNAEAAVSKKSMCIGCHGIAGYKASFPDVYKVPYIAGQNAKYIESALNAYKKGERKHPTMHGIAQSLTEQDIADLAAHYSKERIDSSQNVKITSSAGQAKAVAQCAACHAVDGNWNKTMDSSYPKLAGQHEDYIVNALKQYQKNRRNNAIMVGVAAGLSQKDINDLAAFFASLKGDLYLKK